MRVSNQRSPLLGRDFDEGLMAVGMEACVRATKAEGAGIARMMQDPKDTRMLELIPHDVAFVRSMCDAAETSTHALETLLRLQPRSRSDGRH
jgi:hypothetical protein